MTAFKKRGPKTTITPEMIAKIKSLKRGGMTWQAIADRFGYGVVHLQRTVGPQREWAP